MKKTVLFLSLLVSHTAFSQSAFTKGENVVTVGYGFPNIYKRLLLQDMQNTDVQLKSLAKNYGSTFTYATKGAGPFMLKYEHGLTDKLGLGFVIGYFNTKVTETYTYKKTIYNPQTNANENKTLFQAVTRHAKNFSVAARFNYHFGEKKKIDPYIGLSIGYSHTTLEDSFTTDDPTVPVQASEISTPLLPLSLAGTIGVRDYITDNFGVYVEIGFEKWSFVQAGFALKLPK